MDKCLTKNCQKEKGTRGLCTSCYATARVMMKNGEATEKQFVDRGMMLPKVKGSASLFKQQFNNQ